MHQHLIKTNICHFSNTNSFSICHFITFAFFQWDLTELYLALYIVNIYQKRSFAGSFNNLHEACLWSQAPCEMFCWKNFGSDFCIWFILRTHIECPSRSIKRYLAIYVKLSKEFLARCKGLQIMKITGAQAFQMVAFVFCMFLNLIMGLSESGSVLKIVSMREIGEWYLCYTECFHNYGKKNRCRNLKSFEIFRKKSQVSKNKSELKKSWFFQIFQLKNPIVIVFKNFQNSKISNYTTPKIPKIFFFGVEWNLRIK